MSVRAKFKVEGLVEHEGGVKNVTLVPVVSGSKENEEFFRWTPWGKIEIGTINEAASKQFVVGEEVYVDFTPIRSSKVEPAVWPFPESGCAA